MASLVADYSSSNNESDDSLSESDSSNESTSNKINFLEGNTPGNKLPLPDFTTSGGLPLTTSVFTNPFTEAEKAKRAILEQHVKMTPTRDDTKMINGRKICWNFRKGRCRFGHKCKFAHDSDLHNKESPISTQDNVNGLDEVTPVINQIVNLSAETEDAHTEEEETTRNEKRKRPGLSQGLVPGKKVMKMYKKQSQNAVQYLKKS